MTDRIHRHKLTTAAYGVMANDARVLRATRALATRFDVCVLSLRGRNLAATGAVSSCEWPPPTGRNSGLLTLMAFWARFVAFVWKTQPAVVYVHDHYLVLVGWIAARLVGAVPIYDAHELIVPENGRCGSARQRFFYWAERFSIRRYPVLICTNEWRAQIMKDHYRLLHLPTIVKNVPELSISSENHSTPILHSRVLRGDFEHVLIYQGYISLQRGLGVCVEAMAELPPRVGLILLGNGNDINSLTALIREKGLESRVEVLPAVPADDVGAIVRRCSAGIVTYARSGLNNIYCASNKLVEYVAWGLPVVSTDQPPLAQALLSFRIGELVPHVESPVELAHRWARSIRTVLQNRQIYASNFARFLAENNWEIERTRLLNACITAADKQSTHV